MCWLVIASHNSCHPIRHFLTISYVIKFSLIIEFIYYLIYSICQHAFTNGSQHGCVTSCVTSSFSHSFSFVPIQFRCSFPFSVIIYLLRAFSSLGLLRPCLRTPLRATGSVHLTCPSSRSFRTHHMYCFTAPAVRPTYHFIWSSVRYHM